MFLGSHPCRSWPTAVALACSLGLALTALADGDLRTVALTGDQVPDADPGDVFSVLDIPVLNAAGKTAFRGFLFGPGVNSTNNYGIYSEGPGSLTEVARTGNQVPGADPGVVYNRLFELILLNAAGQTAFSGELTGPGVDFTNDRGIYTGGGGTMAEVAREGNQAPGADPGVVFGGFDNPVLNTSGQTAFFGSITHWPWRELDEQHRHL